MKQTRTADPACSLHEGRRLPVVEGRHVLPDTANLASAPQACRVGLCLLHKQGRQHSQLSAAFGYNIPARVVLCHM